MNDKADVVVVGAGVVGSAIARQLSKYDVDVILVEKREDIGGAASRGNQGMIGATSIFSILMYEDDNLIDETIINLFTIANALIYPQWLEELEVKTKKLGTLIVGKDENEMALMEKARQKAWDRGDFRTRMVTKDEAYEMVPQLAPGFIGGYYCPDDLIVDVFDLTEAMVQNAVENGVKLLTGTKALAVDIDKASNAVKGLETDKGYIETRYVINCCAINADELAKTTGYCNFRNYPRYGQTFILDKNLPYCPKTVVRGCPGRVVTGMTVTPTTSGNISIGPSAENGEDKEDSKTTKAILDSIIETTRKLIPAIDPKDAVTEFTGMRAAKEPSNWVIEVSENVKGYCEAIGINQGVTSAPAIACHLQNKLEKDGLRLKPKPGFNPKRKKFKKFADMTEEERSAAIAEDPRYGNVICRCETITEAEIVRAIHTEPYACSMDAIKRRLRAGMGRCQGGFCSPRVVEILARELNVPVETITKNEPGSEIVVGKCRK